MKIIQRYLTRNDCYKSGRRINPVGIQVHTIGTAQNTAQSLADYWNQPGVEACVHYAVDAEEEGKVLQFLPENFRSWADAGYGNNNLITMELMESDHMRYSGGASYAATNDAKFKADILRAYRGGVELCAKICQERGWNPMAKLPSGLYLVSSHDEGRRAGLSSAHVDPTHVWNRFGLTMDQFRKEVKEAMSEGSTVGKKNADGTYTVKKGDTLYAIAQKFGCSVNYLKRWNGLKTTEIAVGQKLKFYYWHGRIISGGAPIREGAGKKKKMVAALPKGTVLEVTGSRKSAAGNKWFKVRYKDKIRYVCAKWIKKA